MAVRTPVYYDGTDIKDMSTAQIDEIKKQARYQYSLNPSVTLSYVASGGSLGTLSDTRKTSSATVSSTTSYPTPGALGSDVTVNYARISETKASVSATADTNNIAFPVYRDASNDLVAMTSTDFLDTFINPALSAYNTTDTTDADFGGLYHIQSAGSYSGSTLINATPIFIDTGRALVFGTSQPTDNPTTVTNYYLYRKDGASVSYTVPLHAYDTGGDIYTPDSTTFDGVLQNMIRYAAVNEVGYRIDYTYTSGTQRGTSMINTTLNGELISQGKSEDDYYAQRHPTGTRVATNTYYLGLSVS